MFKIKIPTTINNDCFLPDLYLRRFRKEKKWRRKLQEQLEVETKKIQALEAALRSLSYDTLVKVGVPHILSAPCQSIHSSTSVVYVLFCRFPSSETCHINQVKESIAREAACRELERQGDGEAGEGGRREREGEEGGRRDEERPNLPPSPHSPPHSRPSPSLPQYSLSSQVSPFLPFFQKLFHLLTFPGSSSAQLQHPAARGWSSPHLLPPLPSRAPPAHGAHLLLVTPPPYTTHLLLVLLFLPVLAALPVAKGDFAMHCKASSC